MFNNVNLITIIFIIYIYKYLSVYYHNFFLYKELVYHILEVNLSYDVTLLEGLLQLKDLVYLPCLIFFHKHHMHMEDL